MPNFTFETASNIYFFIPNIRSKELLMERHGIMKDLRMCIHSFNESNELKDDLLTLYDYGVRGKPLVQFILI